MRKVRLGIIGLGMAWERLHAPALARLTDRFEIVAVCDNNLEKARAAAAWMNLPVESAYDNYHRMLTRPDIDAVDTMVPIYENYECAEAVIKNSKHLLAEKPFAGSPEAAKSLIRLKERMGVKVMVAENFRYDEENVLIKNLISEHRIGNVVYFIDNYVTEFQKDMLGDTFARAKWRKHPDFKGGVFLDSGVHHMSRQRFLFGNAYRVFASGRPSEADFAPYACVNALITFENHIAGHYSFHMTGRETQAPLTGLRIFGTNGEIYLEERGCGYVNISYRDGTREAIPYTPDQGYYHELVNFHEALVNNAAIVSTPEKELGDIELIYAILESAGREETVSLDTSFTPAGKTAKGSNPVAI